MRKINFSSYLFPCSEYLEIIDIGWYLEQFNSLAWLTPDTNTQISQRISAHICHNYSKLYIRQCDVLL